MEQHKRFLVLSFPQYYPGGGFNDLIGSFDTIEAAELFISQDKENDIYEYLQIYDRMEGVLIKDIS